MKEYYAIIWVGNRPGERVTIQADDLDDAKRKLEAKYGEGSIRTLWNEEDAAKPR